ncbi:MAG: endonuclease VIII [Balneola sp.]|jgi:endonuclease-8|nr:endonuclease VIII [Balneola sp.]MBE79496.1 endonuclease VIII [Balneola sp.]|tara:strand:+ start:87 stop:905 length:819 start_codon:yes stop_codon:yes gene_type:complete
MPEGPEIWRAADKIGEAISGKEIEDLFFAFEELKPFKESLVGLKVNSVTPRGKAIITSFENNLNLYSHNQLYGKWIIQNRGNVPKNNRSLRVAIHTKDKSAFLYSASEIEILKDNEVEGHSYIEKLGPDVVHPKTTFEEVLERYKSDTFNNRKLSTLLLDQGFLSGVGNYLRSEILFASKVDPEFRPKDCTESQIEALANNSIYLSRRSYETGGLTTPDDLVKVLKEEGASRRQYRHYVYGREGKPCYKCGREIQVIKTGGRKVYFCETEQK